MIYTEFIFRKTYIYIYIYLIHFAMSESINPEENNEAVDQTKALPEDDGAVDVEQEGDSEVAQETTAEPETSPSTNEEDGDKTSTTVEDAMQSK